MTTLFDPLVAGELRLPNRIVMAPLTRSRAGAERLPNATLDIVPWGGHGFTVTAPDAFNASLVAFLGGGAH